MKVSIVITILNEESTIDLLLAGLTQQITLPNEIILVDGGSTDDTLKIIKQWKKSPIIGKKIHIFKKKGNRSVGRNFGISKAKHSWIAITDAGCIPANNWLQELITAQTTTKAPVIAGYYLGLPANGFQQAVVPYALVMPGRINPKTFLPASRSMMISKSVWQKLGKFDETLDHNEDYVLAKKMEKEGVKITFTDKALVGWLPRKNLSSFYQMIHRFALGDIEANIIRPKVILIFARYLVFLVLLIRKLSFMTSEEEATLLPSLILLYFIWAIMKNSKYLDSGRLWLPVLQVTSDLAVMIGSTKGVFRKLVS